jgi:hypothetical protein
MSHSVIHICDICLTSYLDTFLPGWKKCEYRNDELSAHVRIIDLKSWINNGLALFPFIRFLATAPNVHISIVRNQSFPVQEQEMIQYLFASADTWTEVLFNGTVEDISYQSAAVVYEDGPDTELRPSAFHIVLRKNYEAPWIEHWPEGAEINDYEGALEFLRGWGLTERRVRVGRKGGMRYGSCCRVMLAWR